MSNFTAADVKKLRDMTGAGMMDCKKALEESSGDYEKATEILRIKGAKDVGKRAMRTAANGLVAHAGTALLELNCETDFVAKSPEFIALAQQLVEHLAATRVGVGPEAGDAMGGRPADLEAFLASSLDGRPVSAILDEGAAKLGEKLVVNRVAVLDGEVAVYLHRKASDLPPQVGVLVSYSVAPGGAGKAGTADEAANSDARGAAMQIAAMRPRYVTRDEVPADVVESERRIAAETAREEGKPEAALPKIVEGRVNGFFKDFVLVEQASVIDSKKTVRQVLAEAGITVDRFVRFEVGQA